MISIHQPERFVSCRRRIVTASEGRKTASENDPADHGWAQHRLRHRVRRPHRSRRSSRRGCLRDVAQHAEQHEPPVLRSPGAAREVAYCEGRPDGVGESMVPFPVEASERESGSNAWRNRTFGVPPVLLRADADEALAPQVIASKHGSTPAPPHSLPCRASRIERAAGPVRGIPALHETRRLRPVREEVHHAATGAAVRGWRPSSTGTGLVHHRVGRAVAGQVDLFHRAFRGEACRCPVRRRPWRHRRGSCRHRRRPAWAGHAMAMARAADSWAGPFGSCVWRRSSARSRP